MSISVGKKCYAVMWSYGEICVHCNCCGRFDRNRQGITEARLEYHLNQLQGDFRKLPERLEALKADPSELNFLVARNSNANIRYELLKIKGILRRMK